METKYTKEGQKVVILGKLNSEEYIVQEIYVSESGQEIPAGENFVAKGLLNEKAISWKEKNLIEIENSYKQLKKEYEEKINKLKKQEGNLIKAFEAKCKLISQHIDKFSEDAFLHVSNFISGKYKYFVKDYEIYDFDFYKKTVINDDYGRFEAINLISLFGNTNGDLQYRINRWQDGSGNWSNINFFISLEDAKEFIKNKIEEREKYCEDYVKELMKWGIELNKEKYENYLKAKHETNEKNIKYYEDEIRKNSEELQRLLIQRGTEAE